MLLLELLDGELVLPLGDEVEPDAAPEELLPLAPEDDEDGLL
ncbi:MAG TPA: hypothetical protein VE935_22110 [Burkholderiales bacterium]|nr:hypothetical protein [Burkholderiales bacterium]